MGSDVSSALGSCWDRG